MGLSLAVFSFLGAVFGSFVNALVWRIYQQEQRTKSRKLKAQSNQNTKYQIPNTNLSILTGRSQCVHCGHPLSAKDLVPIFSWLTLAGRCRYCKKPISIGYPLVELAGALTFGASYYFWPGNLHSRGEWLLLITWLAVSVGLLALAVYDFLWFLLPNKIIYPTLAVAIAGRLIYIAGFEPHKLQAFWLWGWSVLAISGLFWLLFMVSSGRWIGYGDVRLGLILGSVLAEPYKSLLVIFGASLMGSLFALPSLLSGRTKLGSKLPYGPFLIMATVLVMLFGQSLINWYKQLLS